ncbi:RCC1 domain-containing protein [Aquella oligotrophica]|uniref:RCC1-like domain-containing protein n=1 Tax=Aquella oligotrophica TaxID=2067065 RepID=A0A2I7N6J5_9NEIS|nr:RCC1 domain-containing protein [Aquella oligotrophica]AUR52062.1 hypothetical protein CUN60_07035 [Aquella oligotrophica]
MKYKYGILAISILLASCSGSGSGGSSNNGNNDNPVVSSNLVEIDQMTTVPVVNGFATTGIAYIHNYSDDAISSPVIELGNITNNSLEDNNGFKILNTETCGLIPAHGYCQVKFQTPALTVGNRNNAVMYIKYGKDHTKSAYQVINYAYTDLSAKSGVNFTGSLTVTSPQNTTRHVIGYLMGSGQAGQVYNNVTINSNSSVKISNGFVNGQQVAAGQVIPVEFAVSMQSNRTTTAILTPLYDSSIFTAKNAKSSTLKNESVWNDSSSQSSLRDGSGGSGNPLTVTLTPAVSQENLIFGVVPTLTAPTSSAVSVAVVNNGNKDTQGLVISSNNAALIVNQGSCNGVIQANAANSCSFTLSVDAYVSGNATLTYTLNGVSVGSQNVVWTNDQPYPAIYLEPAPGSISVGAGLNSQPITFTVSNTGKAPLSSVVYSATSGNLATWTQDSTTCTTTIAPQSQCAITGHLTGVTPGSGILFIKAAGTFNGTSYSFGSLPVNYTVTNQPNLVIDSDGGSLNGLANGTVENLVFTITNYGNDTADISGVNLVNTSGTSIQPTIDQAQSTCGSTLAAGASCQIVVTLGAIPPTVTTSETGNTTLQINYSASTGETHTSNSTITYNVLGNNSSISTSIISATDVTGSGTQADPYSSTGSNPNAKITLRYHNNSPDQAMTNFNINAGSLPLGLIIDPSSSCPIGQNVTTIPVNGYCDLVVTIDYGLMSQYTASSNFGGAIAYPPATWTTSLGFYSQNPGDVLYLNLLEATLTYAVSNNNSNFTSTELTITATNAGGYSTLTANVSGVKKWLTAAPTGLSNCTLNSSDNSLACNMLTSGSAAATYTMPTYFNEAVDIPLTFTYSAGGGYAFQNPSFIIINHQPLVVTGFASISSSLFYSCGVTTSGKAYCWGGNAYGQLGNANTGTNSNVPVAVSTTTGLTDTNVASITVGSGGTTCAITKSGKAYCWGSNNFGQLGNANTGTNSNVPVAVSTTTGLTDTNVATISPGNSSTCAVTKTGKAYCWGRNHFGQLGNGDATNSNVPVAVSTTTGLTDTNVAIISTGTHYACGVTTLGKAYCWGYNNNGQLGNANTGTSSNVPVAVSTTTGLTNTNVATISAGTNTSCVVTKFGKAYCWGINNNGQLGNATNTASNVPVAVSTTTGLTDTNVAMISAGQYATCGVTTFGKAYCWGTNAYGQLGNGNTGVNSNIPVAVLTTTGLTDTNVAAISAGPNFTCALTTSKEIYCWGYNENGELGIGNYINNAMPTQVTNPW